MALYGGSKVGELGTINRRWKWKKGLVDIVYIEQLG
jgi:hypothetical protein